jgi:DNA repair exonuclease SbcCD ATPase subunit
MTLISAVKLEDNIQKREDELSKLRASVESNRQDASAQHIKYFPLYAYVIYTDPWSYRVSVLEEELRNAKECLAELRTQNGNLQRFEARSELATQLAEELQHELQSLRKTEASLRIKSDGVPLLETQIESLRSQILALLAENGCLDELRREASLARTSQVALQLNKDALEDTRQQLDRVRRSEVNLQQKAEKLGELEKKIESLQVSELSQRDEKLRAIAQREVAEARVVAVEQTAEEHRRLAQEK